MTFCYILSLIHPILYMIQFHLVEEMDFYAFYQFRENFDDFIHRIANSGSSN